MQHQHLSDKTDGILNFSDYKKTSARVFYASIVIFLIVAALIAFLPPLWLFVSSFKEAKELTAVPYHLFPQQFDPSKIVDVWQMVGFTRYFINTLLIVLGAVFCAVFFNGLLAYAIAIVKPAGAKFVFGLVLAGYMIPAITSIVPLYNAIVGLHLINSYVPLMLVFGANAFYLIMLKNYFESIPSALFDAARVDGCSAFAMFVRIVIPLSGPIVGVIGIFAVTASWSDFLLPYLVLQSDKSMSVMVKIYNLQTTMGTVAGFGPDKLLMVLTISILPEIALFVFFQKQITGTSVSSGIKE
jgi:multiple sugar transport system permease protein